MEWHLKATGDIEWWQTVRDSDTYISRDVLFKDLRLRYNMPKTQWGLRKTILLPSTRTSVEIVYNDPKAVIQSLLTDPRIRDKDYSFYNNDPFACPPDGLDYIGELNTGEAFRKTHAKLITKPNQILLPIIPYYDGAMTGQFMNLPINPVKISLGIFTRKACDRDFMWGTLGYMPVIKEDKSRGKHLFRESNHMDAGMAHPDYVEGEGNFPKQNKTNDEISYKKAQDFHAILASIFEEYLKLQGTGFVWDLRYRNHLYRDVEFVVFHPFIKLDTKEADKTCGSYESRSEHVAQLCRECHYPYTWRLLCACQSVPAARLGQPF